MKKISNRPVLFVDRDGVIVQPCKIDTYEKIIYRPGVFNALSQICREGNFEIVMVSNQDGVDTPMFPHDSFYGPHNRIVQTLEGEGVRFDDFCIDLSLPEDNCPGRKPGTAMLEKYRSGDYDLQNSFMIGDRLNDMRLAKNMGIKGIWFASEDVFDDRDVAPELIPSEDEYDELKDLIALQTDNWLEIANFLVGTDNRLQRKVTVSRNTKETKIELSVNLDGSGKGEIHTGIEFFDHMLSQVLRHSNMDINLKAEGDLGVDEHHTVEDIAIVLGSAIREALGDKRGISRYGFNLLTMDEVLAQCALDFSGRPYLVWDVEFKREYVGTFPTEMFEHFFKSFSDAAQCNLNITVSDGNTHHMIEAVYKCFAKAIRQAIYRYPFSNELPSTKGML
ncbi:MAG: bifunctional histidinol-phosphatase/imidazoleglycerol-phosphate dehydratase HisB [Sphaerochaetaceae bacterium]|nr:bifunctional histidinol-phosphatase/imidazoleglycerol-phosphate dehydratase HisB [Sphaerochaetaceae bacterium]